MVQYAILHTLLLLLTMYTTEEFRRQVYLWYDMNGIVPGDPSAGRWEQAHIVPRCAGGTETVLLLHGHHIMHDLYQSREYNRLCFFPGDARTWLYGEGFLCENWFELVELYECYVKHNGAEFGRRVQARWEKTTLEEKSTHGCRLVQVRWAESTPEDRRASMAATHAATKARWAALTPEERSTEMSRRRRLGQERKRALHSLGPELHGALWAAEPL